MTVCFCMFLCRFAAADLAAAFHLLLPQTKPLPALPAHLRSSSLAVKYARSFTAKNGLGMPRLRGHRMAATMQVVLLCADTCNRIYCRSPEEGGQHENNYEKEGLITITITMFCNNNNVPRRAGHCYCLSRRGTLLLFVIIFIYCRWLAVSDWLNPLHLG